MGKLFGTDGVRGVANEELTPELAYKLARAGAYVLAKEKKGRVIIGRDTRASGAMLESAMTAGLLSMGIDVLSLGVIPTPAVAYLTREYDGLAGIVISASHNPFEDNGIKFFDHRGLKLPDRVEAEIEDLIKNKRKIPTRAIGGEVGRLTIYEKGQEDYIDYLTKTIPVDLKGIKVAMDCGHGALSTIGPETIKRLGGEVVAINTDPNGMNINDNCGSTNPQMIEELVLREKADIGVSFDGDADRIIAVDEKGKILDGDHILAICGSQLYKEGKLKNNTIVGTVMTNMGLDDYLKENGISIKKTKVGDRYILEEMVESGYSLGGEQSGHIIFLDYNTTGDGLATALHLLEVMKTTGETMSSLNNLMTDYPQVLVNAKVANGLKYNFDKNEDIMEEIRKIEELFHGQGRVLIRPSGTEPLVRVMIEAKEDKGIEKIAKDLADFIEGKLSS